MKRYFRDGYEDESCYRLAYWKQFIKDEGLESLTLFEAEMETNTEYFYCSEFGEVGIKDDDHLPCGKSCDSYTPRNGESGRCKFSKNCYTATDTKIVITNPLIYKH